MKVQDNFLFLRFWVYGSHDYLNNVYFGGLELPLINHYKSFVFIFVFLRLYPQHMEVPRLGVKSEL